MSSDMSPSRRLAPLLILLVSLLVPAAASAAAPKPLIGTAIVFQRGFDVMYWDSFTGLRKLARGDEPSISSNGRFVAYQQRGGSGCGKVVVLDLRSNAKLSLPGIETGSCVSSPAFGRRALRHLRLPGPGRGRSQRHLSVRHGGQAHAPPARAGAVGSVRAQPVA